jgi:hypothetical protein
MKRPSQRMAYWALSGAAIGVLLSIITVFLPPELGGYVDWRDPHLAFHNTAAILSRITVFALIGAALAGRWHHRRRRTQR